VVPGLRSNIPALVFTILLKVVGHMTLEQTVAFKTVVCALLFLHFWALWVPGEDIELGRYARMIKQMNNKPSSHLSPPDQRVNQPRLAAKRMVVILHPHHCSKGGLLGGI
jgi:hypothetical protein